MSRQRVSSRRSLKAISGLLERLRATRKLALVIVEQRLEFVAALASRALVMQRGSIIKEMPATDFRRPRAAVEEIVGIGPIPKQRLTTYN